MNGCHGLLRSLKIWALFAGALLAGADAPNLSAQEAGASTSLQLKNTDAFPAGTIVGVVYDVESGIGVKDAQVFIDEPQIGALTDSLGRFTLRGAKPGSSTLVIQLIGYTKIQTTIELEAGRALAVTAGITEVGIPVCGNLVCLGPFGCYSIEVVVRDLVTGVAPLTEVTLRVRGSVASDSMSLSANPGQAFLHLGAGGNMVYTGPDNDRGPYEVEVTAPGYERWRKSDVRRDVCKLVLGNPLRVWLIPGR
jgi:hypothetical protein